MWRYFSGISSEKEEINKVAILPEDIYLSDTKPPGPDVNRSKED